ncbi:unnamed protein product, partial [Oikopleura dioica]
VERQARDGASRRRMGHACELFAQTRLPEYGAPTNSYKVCLKKLVVIINL